MAATPDDQWPPDITQESAEDLYHRAPCGYLTSLRDGTIVRVNQTFLDWTGYCAEDVIGRRFVDLVGTGGRIFHETHYSPLLLMQGEVREIAFDIVCADGLKLPVLVNSLVVEPSGEATDFIRTTVFDATLRQRYEDELRRARVRAEESEKRVRAVAETLQRSLLQGGLSEGPGFLVQYRYRPAVESLEVGGDWYDTFMLADGKTLAVSVGDVVGRGITAAGAMGQLRTAVRAIAGTGVGPGQLLDQLDAFVERIPDAHLATVAYAELDLEDGHVRFACAGHMPPVVVHEDGEPELLWGGRSTPLAAFPLDEPRPEATTELGEASRLLLYTDGLIERRNRSLDDSLALLTEAVGEVRALPLVEMADRLMDVLLADEDTRDDVCLLAVCLEPTEL